MTTEQALISTVQRGAAVGTILRPHKFVDGCYVASPTRFEKDYIRVPTLDLLIDLWKRGYSVRMSTAQGQAPGRQPSLIKASSIRLQNP